MPERYVGGSKHHCEIVTAIAQKFKNVLNPDFWPRHVHVLLRKHVDGI